MFHLIPYLTNDGPYNNENTIYQEIKENSGTDKNLPSRLYSSPILRLDNKQAVNVLKNYIKILKGEEQNVNSMHA